MKLFEIVNEYQQALDELSGMELTPEIVNDSLSAIQCEFRDKAINVAAYIQNIQYEENALKEEIKRMQERQKKTAKKIESLKFYLMTNMSVCNMPKITTTTFDISIRKNPPRLILDEEKISKDFIEERIVTEIIINKKAIKEAIDNGIDVVGARVEQSLRLHIN